MRALLSLNHWGHVLLTHDVVRDFETIERVTRRFSVPVEGGAVREGAHPHYRPVYVGLRQSGPLLYCVSPARLLSVIRREYRNGQRYVPKAVAAT